MLKFKQFILAEAEKEAPKLKKQSLPEIWNNHVAQEKQEEYSMHHRDLQKLVSSGSINLPTMTEKTDGVPHKIVYEPETGSLSVRNSVTGYERHLDSREAIDEHCRQAFNKNPKTRDIPGGYDGDHPLAQRKRRIASGISDHLESLQNNKALMSYMKKKAAETGQRVVINGELFHKSEAKTANDYDEEHPETHQYKNLHPNERMTVVTPYSEDRLKGDKGMFVVHSQMNPDHDTEQLKKVLGTKDYGVDDDIIRDTTGPVDVSKESKALNKLLFSRVGDNKQLAHPDPNHPINNMSVADLLDSPADKKDAGHIQSRKNALDQYSDIAKQIKQKVGEHLSNTMSRSKWNSNTHGPNGESRSMEGLVLHGDESQGGKFKALSEPFLKTRAEEQEQKKAAKK